MALGLTACLKAESLGCTHKNPIKFTTCLCLLRVIIGEGVRGQSRGGSKWWRRNDLPLLQLVQQLFTPTVQVIKAGLGAAIRVLRWAEGTKYDVRALTRTFNKCLLL